MERIADLITAISLCLFFAALSYVGWVHMGMEKQRLRAGVCVRQMLPQLDLWVSSVIAMTKTARCDEHIVSRLQGLAEEYSGSKKSREYLKIVPCVNEISNQLLMVENARLSQNPSELNTEAVRRIQALGTEYNRCVNELGICLTRRAAPAIAKLFRVHKLESFNDYFEKIYN